jgi:hypothetical protein
MHIQQSTKRGSRIYDGGSNGKGEGNGNSDGDRNRDSNKDDTPRMCLSVTQIEIASGGQQNWEQNIELTGKGYDFFQLPPLIKPLYAATPARNTTISFLWRERYDFMFFWGKKLPVDMA